MHWTERARADSIAQGSVAGTTIYARALERLYQVNCIPAALKKGAKRTHPDLYDRMLAAGLTPDYPRPAAPSGQGWTSAALTVLCVFAAMQLTGL